MSPSKKTLAWLFLFAYLLGSGLSGHRRCPYRAVRASDTPGSRGEAAIRPILPRGARSCHRLPLPPILTSSLADASRERAARWPANAPGTLGSLPLAASSLLLSRAGSARLSLPPPGSNPQLAHIRTIVLLI